MFAPSRDEARRFLIERLGEAPRRQPLVGVGADGGGDLIALHPEYHAILEAPGASRRSRLSRPRAAKSNPFLHLSLHLAVAEQLAIDQPPGIRAHFERLRARAATSTRRCTRCSNAWARSIWHAQRHGTPPDAALYLACLERQP